MLHFANRRELVVKLAANTVPAQGSRTVSGVNENIRIRQSLSSTETAKGDFLSNCRKGLLELGNWPASRQAFFS